MRNQLLVRHHKALSWCFRFFSVWIMVALAISPVIAMDTIFGSTDASRGGFRGEVYVIPEKVDRIPNFTHLRSVGLLYTRTINVKTQKFDGRLPNATRPDWFAIRYVGTYDTQVDGKYRFRLKSDDGSKLYVDNQLVIDNDGLHGTRDKHKTIRLTRGRHYIEVQYFQGRDKVCLALYVKEPKQKEKHFTASAGAPPAAMPISAPAPSYPVATPVPVSQQPTVPVYQPPVSVPGIGSSGQLTGFSLHSNNGNTIGYGASGELCSTSMIGGGSWAQMPVPYNINAPYSVTFDFKITETNNHFILIYYDDFVCVDIDWGKQISHYQPGSPYQLKQLPVHLNPHQWYSFRIDANPSGQTYTLFVDGKKISTATGIVPGHRFLKANQVIDTHPNTIFLGDVEPDTSRRGGIYNRGSGCWRNMRYEGGAGGGNHGSSFGSSTFSSDGFRGNIYYLATGTRALPDFGTMNPVGSIYTRSINVPNQSFTKGFPGVTDRFEWFGIRYTASFRVDQPGQYQFRCYSDDGTKLWVDSQMIINNDGTHPARNKTGGIYLNPGVHNIQLDYFQGPRTMVALQFFMTPPGGTEKIFDGVFQSSGTGSTGVFGGQTYVAGALRGDIYHLPTGTRSLPDFRTMTPAGSIYATSLNVPNQSFTRGFPGVTNRFEWFGLRYTGQFQVNQPGEYQFRCYSDDGSKLWINGQLIVNNDGIHPARNKTGRIYLNPGVHNIQLDYFQGPRAMVALQLFMTPPGGGEQLFQSAAQYPR